jgi:hypothetical protein
VQRPNPLTAPAFPIAFDQADVLRLCGAAAFAHGDSFERSGKVLNPRIGKDGLSSSVRGTWRRVDEVTVSAVNGQLRTGCSCQAGPFCRHAAALMLHWLRDRSAFIDAESVPAGHHDTHTGAWGVLRAEEPPIVDLVRLLERDTVDHLRLIARRRGVRAAGKNKAGIIRNLSIQLAQPEGIDAALAELSADERLVLEATHLLGAVRHATTPNIAIAYALLGGQNPKNISAMLNALFEAGLAIREDWQYAPSARFIVPRVVADRLPPRPDLVGTLDGQLSQAASTLRLTIEDVFHVIITAVRHGEIGREAQVHSTENSGFVLPPGWQVHPDDLPALEPTSRRSPSSYEVRLIPRPPILVSNDRAALARRTGQPKRMIDFAVELLLALGILEIAARPSGYALAARPDRFELFLALTPEERAQHLLETWYALSNAFELGSVVSEHGRLRFHYRLARAGYGYVSAPDEPNVAALRRLATRVVDRLGTPGSEERRYDAHSFLDLLMGLAPALLHEMNPHGFHWWFTATEAPDTPLKLDNAANRHRVWAPLLAALLAGPMQWLGLVEILKEGDKLTGFRLRSPEQHTGSRPLTVELDGQSGVPMITVPPGLPAATTAESGDSLHALLSSIGELTAASRQGLRYQLTPRRLQAAFDAGLTGPQLLDRLTAVAGGRLAPPVQAVLDGWWARYGRIRLYDELTLLELGDDILLKELLATSRLRAALVAQLSPRLAAVDPARVDDLIAELTRLGYMPRVVEAAAGGGAG